MDRVAVDPASIPGVEPAVGVEGGAARSLVVARRDASAAEHDLPSRAVAEWLVLGVDDADLETGLDVLEWPITVVPPDPQE